MDYKTYLSKDKKLKKLLKHEVAIPKPTKHLMVRLVKSILGQQLSVQVAKVMYERFLDLFNGKLPGADDILSLSVEEIKAIGISRPKANYIHNVAQFFKDRKITAAKLNKMSEEEVIELLTEIKGVGRWTVEMLLLFGMGKEDVFAVDDLGVQKGMIEIFELQDLPKKDLLKKMNVLSEKWSPFRSYVCLMMWKDQTPVPKKPKKKGD